MKYILTFFFAFVLLANTTGLYATELRAGEEQQITDDIDGDLYLAGGTIRVDARVEGDLLAAGGNISVNDSISGDIMLTGGDLHLNGYTGDDVRAFGGDIKLSDEVAGDVIVFGGEVYIERSATIHGDLVIFGGYVVLDGAVKGAVKLKGANFQMNGYVGGDMDVRTEHFFIDGEVKGNVVLVADRISLGEEAAFYGDVTYWSESGEIDFGGTVMDGTVYFDPELKPVTEISWKKSLWGFTAFIVLYALAMLLLLLFVNYLFRSYFERAAKNMEKDMVKSLVYGVLYLVATPMLAAFLLITIIGIPISFLVFALYGFSLLVGRVMAAVLLSHFLKHRYSKNWGSGMLLLVSIGIFIALRLVSFIPFIGWLISLTVLSLTFGQLIVSRSTNKKAADRN